LSAYRAVFRSKSDVMVVDPSGDFFRSMRSGIGAPAATNSNAGAQRKK
jgi:membrane protease subunit HflC